MTQPGGAGTAAVIDGSGFVHRTNNVDESVNGNKTFTGTTDATANVVNITPSTNRTSGSALNVNTGTSAPGVGNTQGFGINVTGSSAFAENMVRIENGGTFSGTLLNLVANGTTSGTILGISATSLTTGKAIDVQLSALYAGSGGNTGAINVQAGAFTGNIFSVSSLGTGQLASSNLANLTSEQLVGRLLYVNATGAYSGAGAVEITLNPTAGTPSGTALLVNAKSGFSGKFVDFQILGSGSVFSVDAAGVMSASGISTTGNFAQTGAGTFSTGTGAVSLNGATTLNGDVTLASGKNFTAAGGASAFDFSAASGAFSTSTGAVGLNGDVTIASGKNFTQSGAGTFSTGSGANSLNGDVTVASGKTVTAAQNTTTGTAVNLANAGTLSTGKILNVDMGAGAFSTNGAVAITSTGNFTGTLERLTANSTTAGTVLGVTATSLATGKAVQVDLGTAVYTGTGAVDVTADSASSGTLVNVSGTTLGANNGTGIKVATGTPAGADPTISKALSVALGNAGDGLYMNTGATYTGNLVDLRKNATSLFTISDSTISTTLSFSQTGAATFSTGTGAVSLNGDTTVASGSTFTASQGVTAGTGSTFTTGNGLTAGTAVAINTGTSTFSTATGGALGITSTGAFTGTLAQITGNSSTAGTALGVTATGLTTGKAVALTLGTAGTGLFINSTTGYTGNFIDLQVNSASKFSVNQAGSTTIAQGGTLTLGGTNGTTSTPITAHYSATTSFNLGSVTQATCLNQTMTVTGARAGDIVVLTPTGVAGGAETLNLGWFGWVSANDTVTIRFCAYATGNPGAQTWRADVWRH